jgi:hypothetical protein
MDGGDVRTRGYYLPASCASHLRLHLTYVNLLNTKLDLVYIRNQSVPL